MFKSFWNHSYVSFCFDDVLSELYFKLQVDEGLRELDEGKGIPHQEVKERMSIWVSE